MKLTDYDRTVIAETLAARAKELSTTSGDIRKAARESVYQTATDALAGHATADAIEKEAARLRELVRGGMQALGRGRHQGRTRRWRARALICGAIMIQVMMK